MWSAGKRDRRYPRRSVLPIVAKEGSMGASTRVPPAGARIRALLDGRGAAVHAKDVAGLVAAHAPDVTMFDVVPPLAYQGADTVRTRAAAWVAAYCGPIGYAVRDVRLTVGQ